MHPCMPHLICAHAMCASLFPRFFFLVSFVQNKKRIRLDLFLYYISYSYIIFNLFLYCIWLILILYLTYSYIIFDLFFYYIWLILMFYSEFCTVPTMYYFFGFCFSFFILFLSKDNIFLIRSVYRQFTLVES